MVIDRSIATSLSLGKKALAHPYTRLVAYLVAMVAPVIALTGCIQSFGHYERAQDRLLYMMNRLNALESFDLRDLKRNDRLLQLSQIPLLGSDSTTTLKFVSESSVEANKLRETPFSMATSSGLDMGALMQILEILHPTHSKVPPRDLLVRSFKVQNDKNLSVQISLLKREPR